MVEGDSPDDSAVLPVLTLESFSGSSIPRFFINYLKKNSPSSFDEVRIRYGKKGKILKLIIMIKTGMDSEILPKT